MLHSSSWTGLPGVSHELHDLTATLSWKAAAVNSNVGGQLLSIVAAIPVTNAYSHRLDNLFSYNKALGAYIVGVARFEFEGVLGGGRKYETTDSANSSGRSVGKQFTVRRVPQGHKGHKHNLHLNA